MSDPISKIIYALKNDRIIPDVIPASYSFTPTVLFSVVWSAQSVEVVLGDKIPREKTIEEPEIKLQRFLSLEDVDDGARSRIMAEESGDVKYTLVMTDPDAPSRDDPKFGQWRHWVITGVQLPVPNATEAESLYALKTKEAETPYCPPAPPPGSGYHRYIFLLFQEPTGGISLHQDAVEYKGDTQARPKWDALAFAEEYGLKLVGINYFMTQVSK